MKLTQFEISNFQCVLNSNPIRVEDITCLLGKNEAGKTALLKALYRLNPVIEGDSAYDVVDDYPRGDVDDYEQAVATGQREPATVCRADFHLEDEELQSIAEEFGSESLNNPILTLSKGYGNTRSFFLDVNLDAAYQFYIKHLELPLEVSEEIRDCTNFGDLAAKLEKNHGDSGSRELAKKAHMIHEQGLDRYIYLTFLRPKLPKFVYFNDYYQLRGQEDLEALKERLQADTLRTSDHAILGLLNLARLNVDQLIDPDRTQLLINKLEGAGNHISEQVFKYWSQNPGLRIKFDVRPVSRKDPSTESAGIHMWTSVFDPRRSHSTLLSTRSRGFVWFFSFLAWYSQLKEYDSPIVLLLDEPGLHLHPKAQSDLLRFFEEVLGLNNQLIYTTHSPFMIPAKFHQIRYVEDISLESEENGEPEFLGTQVTEDQSKVSLDSILPVEVMYQPQQGQETRQIKDNLLLVKDVTDLLYLRGMSIVLSDLEYTGFKDWKVVPVGGVENIPSVISQINPQSNIVAVLSGIEASNKHVFEALQSKKLLDEPNIKSITEFSETQEAEIEDLFDVLFYMNLINAAYRSYLKRPIAIMDLGSPGLCIKNRVADYLLSISTEEKIIFNPRRPARLFADNVTKLKSEITSATRKRFMTVFDWLKQLSEQNK